MYRIGQEEIDAVERVIRSKKLFKINEACKESMHAEEEICSYLDTDYAIVMTSGHAALVSALIAAGIGPGDQVIVPAYTYIASAMSVVGAGAIPVIAEVDESLTLDPEDVEMLQDLVVSAVNEALRQAEDAMSKSMNAFTGGLGIPGL